MTTGGRWEYAITHRGDDLDRFVSHYLGQDDRSVVVFAGAGFDPRTPLVAEKIASVQPNTRGYFIQEIRPESDLELKALAELNTNRLKAAVPDYEILPVEIFSTGNAVVGGRRIAESLNGIELVNCTDVVVDISAMSIGISFPAIKLLRQRALSAGSAFNLHVFVAHQAGLDARITPVAYDRVETVHGFDGELTLTSTSRDAAKLWLPQVAANRAPTLRRIYDNLQPNEVCPIVPFPAQDPRLGDDLLEQLINADGASLEADARDIVYADESDPLDLYRTILRLHRLRQPVFEELGGSKLILSPVGSKVMALGALLAALERDLPVIYVEDFGYEYDQVELDNDEAPELLHVWLERTDVVGPTKGSELGVSSERDPAAGELRVAPSV